MYGAVLALLPSAEDTIKAVGYFGLLAIVFAESGLLIGCVLPGDSLLFFAGFVASGPASLRDQGLPHLPLWPLLLGVALAAIVGDQVGYALGKNVGPRLFNRPDSRVFRRQYVDRANMYFEKYGPKTIVIARFVPVVRTFTPMVAGVSGMNHRKFTTYNVVGGLLWGIGVTLLGYYLGQVSFIEHNLEATILAFVVLSSIPILLEVRRAAKEARAGRRTEVTDLAAVPVEDPDVTGAAG